jgi:hypothetical protein
MGRQEEGLLTDLLEGRQGLRLLRSLQPCRPQTAAVHGAAWMGLSVGRLLLMRTLSPVGPCSSPDRRPSLKGRPGRDDGQGASGSEGEATPRLAQRRTERSPRSSVRIPPGSSRESSRMSDQKTMTSSYLDLLTVSRPRHTRNADARRRNRDRGRSLLLQVAHAFDALGVDRLSTAALLVFLDENYPSWRLPGHHPAEVRAGTLARRLAMFDVPTHLGRYGRRKARGVWRSDIDRAITAPTSKRN